MFEACMTPEQQRNVYVNAILASVKRESWGGLTSPKTWVPGVNMKEWLNLDPADYNSFTKATGPEIEKEMWRRKSQK